MVKVNDHVTLTDAGAAWVLQQAVLAAMRSKKINADLMAFFDSEIRRHSSEPGSHRLALVKGAF